MAQLRASGLVLHRREGERVVYLTMVSAAHGDVGLPKGHCEPQESDLACALRETEEETGLVVRPNRWFVRRTAYEVEGQVKQVVYFLAAARGEVRLSGEHTSFAWSDLDGALAALRHQNLRDVIMDAAVYLKDPALRRGLAPGAARALLEGLVDEGIVAHSKQVAGMARAVAEARGLDADYVEAAAWLHDVGRAKTHGLRHPLEGFRIVLAAGHPGYAPPCLSHFCKGVAPEQLGLHDEQLVREMAEACDLAALTPPEEVIAMADYMALGPRRGTMEQRHKELVSRYGPSEVLDRNFSISMRLKAEFEAETGTNLYALLGIRE